MIVQNPSKELQLNFPVSEIKEKIQAVVKVGSGSGYRFLDKNDVLNTYRISIVTGIYAGIMSITLTETDTNKTQWKSEIMNAVGGSAQPATLSRMQDEFLNILSKGLMGEDVTTDLISSNKAGCFGLVIFLLVSISSILTSLFI